MHDPVLVRRIERRDDLLGDLEYPIDWHGAARNELIERLAIDQLEDEEERAADLFDRVDGGNVWVIQRGQQLRLAAKPRQRFRIREDVPSERFDSDVTP
jgi:hypothetical protein